MKGKLKFLLLASLLSFVSLTGCSGGGNDSDGGDGDDIFVVSHCDTGGIISAVLEFGKPIEQDIACLMLANIANNSTHKSI